MPVFHHVIVMDLSLAASFPDIAIPAPSSSSSDDRPV